MDVAALGFFVFPGVQLVCRPVHGVPVVGINPGIVNRVTLAADIKHFNAVYGDGCCFVVGIDGDVGNRKVTAHSCDVKGAGVGAFSACCICNRGVRVNGAKGQIGTCYQG